MVVRALSGGAQPSAGGPAGDSGGGVEGQKKEMGNLCGGRNEDCPRIVLLFSFLPSHSVLYFLPIYVPAFLHQNPALCHSFFRYNIHFNCFISLSINIPFINFTPFHYNI